MSDKIYPQYGQSTIGKDGIKYKSKFEAEFANKFLFEKYKYEYEKRYEKYGKCDFYLPEFDIYLELVYNDVKLIKKYQKPENRGLVIHLTRAKYEDKDFVKSLGAKWNPKSKTWYIHNTENYLLYKLEKYMAPEHLQEEWFINKGKKFIEGYEERILKKLSDPDIKVLIVSHDDLKFDCLPRLIMAKEKNVKF